MTSEQNKQVIRDQLAAANVNIQASLDQYAESQRFKDFISVMEKAFPHFQVYIQDILAEADKVAVRFRSTGTHAGDLMGIPLTNVYAESKGIILFQLANGKITDYWIELDMLDLLQQLGVVPSRQGQTSTSSASTDEDVPIDNYTASSSPSTAGQSERNKQIIREYIATLNRDKEVALHRYIDQEYLSNMDRTIQKAFPDFQMDAYDLVAEGDKVLVRFAVSGTHTQPLMDIKPTYKAGKCTGMAIYRLANGRIVEYWLEVDRLKLLQTVGAVPAMMGQDQEAAHA